MEYGVVIAIGVVFLFILAILWICLPFAVFGTQPKLEKLIAEAKRSNELLEEMSASLKIIRIRKGTGAG